jgi:hypothetical protein
MEIERRPQTRMTCTDGHFNLTLEKVEPGDGFLDSAGRKL